MAVLSALFAVVYGGCNWLTARRADTLKLYADWELSLPLVPQMIWIYLSLFVLFLLPLFCLGRDELLLLSRRIACGILLSGAAFLLFPAQLGFARVAEPGALFGVIHALDHPHNLVPSLHVVISGLILAALRDPSPPWLRIALAAWFGLICVSVVLVHQHHVLDVIAGILLTYVLMRALRKGETT
jgi:membrane-associated phospholipid phosphatase